MCVPGAMMSGFLRWSEQGPRDEKLTMSVRLSADEFGQPHPSVPVWRLFSDAPTAMMFFAVAGGRTVLALGPAFPAENTNITSWFPESDVDPSRTSESNDWLSAV